MSVTSKIYHLLETADRHLVHSPQADDGWWDALPDHERRQYVQQHPKSKYARDLHRRDQIKTTPNQDENQKHGAATPFAKPNAPAREQLKPAHQDHDKWPEHIKQLRLPPAWQDVRYSPDPHANLQAIGKDAKGRDQYVYSAKFAASQAALKFHRIKELEGKFDEITQQNQRNIESHDPTVKDHGDCMALVMQMGIRPGSDDDTGADHKAYGASTLQGQHVVTDADGRVRLQFVGKKGVHLDLPVENEHLAKMLQHRAKEAGPDRPLFPAVSNASLLSYSHSMDGGSFKTKDFRTLLGTQSAKHLADGMAAPKNEAEYKKAVKMVAVHVSKKLGNTPAIALSAYISPVVFGTWRAGLTRLVNAKRSEHGSLQDAPAGLVEKEYRANPVYGVNVSFFCDKAHPNLLDIIWLGRTNKAKKGDGAKAILRIAALCDKYNVKLQFSIDPHSNKFLFGYYQKLGFIRVGKTLWMNRLPKHVETSAFNRSNNLPDAYFGPVTNPPLDWRKRPDTSPDNDDVQKVPHSVSALLGFNPLEVGVPRKKQKVVAATDPEWWGRYNPLERKAYLTAHPNSKFSRSNVSTDTNINSREDYHKASAAFHHGKRQALDEAYVGKYGYKTPDGNQDKTGMARMRGHHQIASELQSGAGYLLHKHKANPTKESLADYQQSLADVFKHYKTLDDDAKRYKMSTGVGHTRYVSKSQ